MNAPANITFDKTKHDWWKAALKGQRHPIHDGEPMTGFYRGRFKNKQTGEERLYAVAFWYQGERCICQVNGQKIEGDALERAIANWPYISREPVSYEAWTSVVKEGKPWPDQHVVEKAAPAEASNQPLGADAAKAGEPSTAGAAELSKPAQPAVTHTDVAAGQPPSELTPQGKLKIELEQAKAGLTRYVKRGEDGKPINLIDSDDMAGAAQSLRAILLALSGKAKKAREEANRPYREKIDANGKIWSPLEEEAKRFADMLRDGPMKAWEQFKRDQAEAARKAARAAQPDAVGGAAPTIASNAPAPAAKIKGATGKAASVSTVKTAVITDLDKVFQHFRNDKQLLAVLQGLANGAVRAGIEVPGTTVTEEVSIK